MEEDSRAGDLLMNPDEVYTVAYARTMEQRIAELERERDSYKQQAHNLTEQRIACLREISELKAEVERLKQEVYSERLAAEAHECPVDELEAHVRTLREVLSECVGDGAEGHPGLFTHTNCHPSEGRHSAECVRRNALHKTALAALAATEVKP